MANPKPQQHPDQLLLFAVEQELRADGSFIVKPTRLDDSREIDAKQAAKILGYRDLESVYRLVELGEIKGWKPDSVRGNARYRIAWQSVIDYKSRRQQASTGG